VTEPGQPPSEPEDRPAPDAAGSPAEEPLGDAVRAAAAAAAEPAPRPSYWTIPAPPLPEPPPAVRAGPTPWAELPTTPLRVVAAALDLLAQASGDLRRASFYVGLVVLVLTAPLGVLVWRLALAAPELPIVPPGLEGDAALGVSITFAGLIAFAGFVVAGIESRGVGIAVLAARLGRRPLAVRDAVQRSRTVFWRLFGLSLLTNIPLLIVQSLLQELTKSVFGGESEVSVVGASIVTAILFSPVAYVQAGIVLGDVGPVQAVKRSSGMFRARPRTALVVALFEFGAQFVTLFGLSAGLDLVVRFALAANLGTSTDSAATALVAVLIVATLFAVGTLLFTVAAISAAPQVVAFLALTNADHGLDRLRGDDLRFRWLPRPMLAGILLAGLSLVAGLIALG
jgi:hypothetical protein